VLADLIARIDDAPLSAPAYRTARRLLDRQRNGVVRLTHEELRQIAGGEDGTARNHLHQLHAAGLIVYRRNASVTIWWQETATPAAEIADDDDQTADPGARSACTARAQRANCTPSARSDDDQRALSVHGARSACNLHAQRAPVENPDYITTTTTSVVVDDNNNYASSSSSAPPDDLAPQPASAPDAAPGLTYEQLCALYESNIGLITPIMAGTLKTALRTFPPAWIEQAIGLAVRNEVRRWTYVEGILANWQREGFNAKRNSTNLPAAAASNRPGGRAPAHPGAAGDDIAAQQRATDWGPEWYAGINDDDPPDADG